MVKQRRRTAGGGPVHSLTDKLEQRCVDLILDFRRMPLGDDDDENHTGEDAMPPSPEHPEQDDTWQHADLMAEYVRSVEASTRRMKFGIVQAVVESGRTCLFV